MYDVSLSQKLENKTTQSVSLNQYHTANFSDISCQKKFDSLDEIQSVKTCNFEMGSYMAQGSQEDDTITFSAKSQSEEAKNDRK